MMIGRVTGRQVAVNRDGDKPVLLLQVEISDPDDIQTVEFVSQAGIDQNPPNNANVLISKLGDAWLVAFAADDGIAREMSEGDFQIYSSAGGIKIAKVTLKKDGTIRAENSAGYAELSPAGIWDLNGNLTVLP